MPSDLTPQQSRILDALARGESEASLVQRLGAAARAILAQLRAKGLL